jgi:hypothetical protein
MEELKQRSIPDAECAAQRLLPGIQLA